MLRTHCNEWGQECLHISNFSIVTQDILVLRRALADQALAGPSPVDVPVYLVWELASLKADTLHTDLTTDTATYTGTDTATDTGTDMGTDTATDTATDSATHTALQLVLDCIPALVVTTAREDTTATVSAAETNRTTKTARKVKVVDAEDLKMQKRTRKSRMATQLHKDER